MAAASTRDDGDLWFCGIRAEIDYFVFFVEGTVRVGDGDGFEGGEHEMRGVVDEVFG